MLPFVPTGIGEFQTLAHLFQTDTASTLVGFVLGVITVGYFATHAIGAFAKIDTDIAGFGRRDSMLEGILYERDEYHRGDLGWNLFLYGIKNNHENNWRQIRYGIGNRKKINKAEESRTQE